MTFDPAELERRRRAARRTSAWLVALALGIYVAFLASAWLK